MATDPPDELGLTSKPTTDSAKDNPACGAPRPHDSSANRLNSSCSTWSWVAIGAREATMTALVAVALLTIFAWGEAPPDEHSNSSSEPITDAPGPVAFGRAIVPVTRVALRKRSDPELFPAERVVANAFVAAVAHPTSRGRVDPWAKLDDAKGKVSPVLLQEILRGSWTPARNDGLFPRSATIVAVRAIVPYKRQRDEFDRCFVGAMAYNSIRDKPRYSFFVAERAEIPADGDRENLHWTRIIDSDVQQEHNDYWKKVADREEVVDSQYVHPRLTALIPPVLKVPVEDFASHPDLEKLAASPTEGSDERADKLLVRFFDYKAERGKSYVYRIKLFLRDPNNPPYANKSDVKYRSVRLETLEAEIVARILGDDANQGKNVKVTYSEPSEPVSVPIAPTKLFVFEVSAPRGEPEAKMMAVVWDDRLGTHIAGVTDVRRGDVLNFKSDADVLHPLTHTLKRVEDRSFKTDARVMNIRHNEDGAGEVVLLDKDGRRIVRKVSEDAAAFRRHLFLED